jgi:hypothetical protein
VLDVSAVEAMGAVDEQWKLFALAPAQSSYEDWFDQVGSHRIIAVKARQWRKQREALVLGTIQSVVACPWRYGHVGGRPRDLRNDGPCAVHIEQPRAELEALTRSGMASKRQ